MISPYGVFDDVNKIQWDKLPEKFCLKPTHGSGWAILCEGKSNWDNLSTIEKLKKWMKLNYYYIGGEWGYKNIKSRIVVEKLLGNNSVDYNFFCFHGKPTFMEVCVDRQLNNLQYIYFDMNFRRLNLLEVIKSFK